MVPTIAPSVNFLGVARPFPQLYTAEHRTGCHATWHAVLGGPFLLMHAHLVCDDAPAQRL